MNRPNWTDVCTFTHWQIVCSQILITHNRTIIAVVFATIRNEFRDNIVYCASTYTVRTDVPNRLVRPVDWAVWSLRAKWHRRYRNRFSGRPLYSTKIVNVTFAARRRSCLSTLLAQKTIYTADVRYLTIYNLKRILHMSLASVKNSDSVVQA